MTDKEYIEQELLDLVEKEEPECLYIYKLGAELGGFAANQKHRFLLLEEVLGNLLVSLEKLEQLQSQARWKLEPDILGNWEIDGDLFLQV